MDNSLSFAAVAAAAFSPEFIRPLYGSYCFSGIPGSIQKLLSGSTERVSLPADVLGSLPMRYRNVIFCLVDAFGFSFLDEYSDIPALKTLRQEGLASKLTSQFPSTTAVHVTTMLSGLPVNASGVYEWYYYEHKLDEVISPLVYRYAHGNEAGVAAPLSASPNEIFLKGSFFEELIGAGTRIHLSQPADYYTSKYNQYFGQGANLLTWKSAQEGLQILADHALNATGSNYYYYYYPGIDTVCHDHGPGSNALYTEICRFWEMFERQVLCTLRGKLKDTLLIICADHGQVRIDPKSVFLIDREIPEIFSVSRCNKRGEPVYPVGSPRDLFLHIAPEYQSETIAELSRKLCGKADVRGCSELVSEGLFGPGQPGTRLRKNLGDIAILPYAGESINWSKFHHPLYGHHGGLTREEMEIPFIVMPLE